MNLKFQHEQQNRTEERQEMIKAGQRKKGEGEKKKTQKTSEMPTTKWRWLLACAFLVHDTMASLKQKEQRSRLTEIWLTASSGRSSSSSSACRRGKGIGQGHVTRTRNIGYILRLAGGGWLASQSPGPLKGGAALEGVDYFNLWEESGTEDKWLLSDTENKWQHRLAEWVKLVVKVQRLNHDTMRGDECLVRK